MPDPPPVDDMSLRLDINLGDGREFHYDRTWPVTPADAKLRPYMAQHELMKASRAYIAWYKREYRIDDRL